MEFNNLSDAQKWDRIRMYRMNGSTYTDDMKDFMVGKVEPRAVTMPPGAPKKVKTNFPWTLFREVLDGNDKVNSLRDLETKLEELLLSAEEFNVVSREGKTPLELAKESGNEELIDLLERAGAQEGGRRRLRLYVKRRGTKRHGRGRKHRKLRKLTSRRR